MAAFRANNLSSRSRVYNTVVLTAFFSFVLQPTTALGVVTPVEPPRLSLSMFNSGDCHLGGNGNFMAFWASIPITSGQCWPFFFDSRIEHPGYLPSDSLATRLFTTGFGNSSRSNSSQYTPLYYSLTADQSAITQFILCNSSNCSTGSCLFEYYDQIRFEECFDGLDGSLSAYFDASCDGHLPCVGPVKVAPSHPSTYTYFQFDGNSTGCVLDSLGFGASLVLDTCLWVNFSLGTYSSIYVSQWQNNTERFTIKLYEDASCANLRERADATLGECIALPGGYSLLNLTSDVAKCPLLTISQMWTTRNYIIFGVSLFVLAVVVGVVAWKVYPLRRSRSYQLIS